MRAAFLLLFLPFPPFLVYEAERHPKDLLQVMWAPFQHLVFLSLEKGREHSRPEMRDL